MDKTEKNKLKLFQRVNKLEKLSKTIQSAPLNKVDSKTLELMHIGLEVDFERLAKVFNEISERIGSPVRIRF